MDVKILRREMNQLFNMVEALQRATNKFGGKVIVLREMKVDKKKKKELKEESRPTAR